MERFQERKILLLDDITEEPNRTVYELLKSPLGLVEKLIHLCFNSGLDKGFDKLKDELDFVNLDCESLAILWIEKIKKLRV